MRKYRPYSNAFTLIELLISITIFLSLSAVTIQAYNNLSESAKKAEQISNMFDGANVVYSYLKSSIPNLASYGAMHVDLLEGEGFSFTGLKYHTTSPKNSGSFDRNKTGNDLKWFNFTINNVTGEVSTYETPDILDYGRAGDIFTPATSAAFIINKTDTYGIHRQNIHATPQLHFVNFWGKGTPKSDTSYNDVSGDRRRLADRYVRSGNYSGTTNSGATAESDYPTKHNVYSGDTLTSNRLTVLRRDVYIGNSTTLLDEEVFAVKNPDNQSYNKDRAHLFGSYNAQKDGEYYFPVFKNTGFKNIENLSIELVAGNGGTITDSDTLEDGNVSIDIDGLNFDGRNYAQIKSKPHYVYIRFLMHNLPRDYSDDENIDGDAGTPDLISALRAKAATDFPATTSDYGEQFKNRRHLMRDEIRKAGFSAVEFNFAYKLGD